MTCKGGKDRKMGEAWRYWCLHAIMGLRGMVDRLLAGANASQRMTVLYLFLRQSKQTKMGSLLEISVLRCYWSIYNVRFLSPNREIQ